MERETQLDSFPSLANITLSYSSYKPCQKVSAPALFPPVNPVAPPSTKPRICPLITLYGHHSGPGCHCLSPGSLGSWHQPTPSFHPSTSTQICPCYLPPHPGHQPTDLLAVDHTLQTLPASGSLHLLCSLCRSSATRYPRGGSLTSNMSLL